MFDQPSIKGIKNITFFQLLLLHIAISLSPLKAQTQEYIKIDLQAKNATLKEVLEDIEKKTNLTFIYFNSELPLDKRITINVSQESLSDIFNLFTRKCNIVFERVNHSIIVKRADTKGIKSAIDGTVKIFGKVTDVSTGKPLIGANIFIEGTPVGAATGSDGTYLIPSVPLRTHSITYTYIGFQQKRIEIHPHYPDESIELNVKLQTDILEGEMIVITAQAGGQLNAINQQISANTIKNVVSSERLQENPDANAAEAIGRLPGISLIRSGGEGKDIVIRGMKPGYSTVSLNGIQLTSTDLLGRNTSISGISQFLLQSVEVYKTITPDMDGNSVAGSINLKLSKAPDNLNFRLLAQGGYNRLNNDWGNFKFVGNISSRFFDNKFGGKIEIDIERVNRSAQTMSANYSVNSNIYSGLKYEPVLLQNVALNDITNIPQRLSGSIVLDYNFSQESQIFFYNLFSQTNAEYINVNKFNSLQLPVFTTNISQNNNINSLFSSLINFQHSFGWSEFDLGLAYSRSKYESQDNRNWTLQPYGVSHHAVTNEIRALNPEDALFTSIDEDNFYLNETVLYLMGLSSDNLHQENISPQINLKFPFTFGASLSGYFKIGGKYNYITRQRDYISAQQNPTSITTFGTLAASEIDWVTLNSSNMVNSINLVDQNRTDFYNEEYSFGWYPNIERLNQLWEWWNNLSNALLAEGRQAVVDQFGFITNVGFTPDILNSSLNNQDMDEEYWAYYLMSEINYRNLIIFIPGVRYEKVTNNLRGRSVINTPSIYGLSIPGEETDANHIDENFLPMIHLRFKPLEWMHIHSSFTKTLKRPDYVSLIPNEYINNIFGASEYIIGNPNLNPEVWTNFDLNISFYTNTIGLFAINGFYKNVEDKIWRRTYNRLPDDPTVPGFEDNAIVSVTETVNHQDPGFVQGIEFEWQTIFWYLPAPFNYLTLNANYTFLKSEIQYPTTRVYTTYEIGENGRPTVTMNRVDSAFTNQLEYQPNNIANISLGFNYKGLNAWLSFQYSGKMLTGWRSQRELIPYQMSFSRWDIQIAQKLPVEGTDLLFSLANINNFTEESKLSGDNRPTYLENYGWTMNLGIRYTF